MSATAAPAPVQDRRPPGPKGHWLIGCAGEIYRDILAFYTRCAREYGDVAGFRFTTRQIYLLSHPDFIEDVLVTHNDCFRKNYLLRILAPLLGEGVLISEGDFWLRQRRLLQPAFARQRIHAYGAAMVRQTERMLEAWQPGTTRDLHEDLMALTLAIVAETLFGAHVEAATAVVGPALDEVRDYFIRRMTGLLPLPLSWPTPANRRLKKAIADLDAIIYDFIARRRASGEDRGDLLSMLLQARDEDDGTQMTDRQVRDEAMTLFLAGHETTAIALSWICYLLARDPGAFDLLHTELRQVLAGRAPTVADLPRLKFTEMVVLEGMRLYPPAYIIGREAVAECVIGGYRVRPGTTVLMSQWVVQRDPRFFPEPEAFKPERWANDLQKRLPKYAYFPFGGGPRLCIGNTFAMMEAVLVLATVAQRYRFVPVSAEPVVPQPTVTLRPRGGMDLRVEAV
jgi:cytochrome P450